MAIQENKMLFSMPAHIKITNMKGELKMLSLE
jgi:hypothetical protein